VCAVDRQVLDGVDEFAAVKIVIAGFGFPSGISTR
jgi:hypothetical protein